MGLQGPPGTGKSSFITEAVLSRVPERAKVLCCTSTNQAIDSLVSKFHASGISEIIAVGNAERMGAMSAYFTMDERLARDPQIAKAEAMLAKCEARRECAEQEVEKFGKLKKKKADKASGESEDNPLFVKRQLEKLPLDTKKAKKTPGVTRLIEIVGLTASATITNQQLIIAAKESTSVGGLTMPVSCIILDRA